MLQHRQRTADLLDGVDHRFQLRRLGRVLAVGIQIELNPPQGKQEIILDGA